MNTFEPFLEILRTYQPITLQEMDGVKLLNRTDVKFVFTRDKLPKILQLAHEKYRSLVVDDALFAVYETNYFDTSNFTFYYDHHNGRLNRFKVRMRSYVNSDLHFFEIKHKNNKSRTIKSRIKIAQQEESITEHSAELLQQITGIPASLLAKTLQVNCKRITLVNTGLSERVTIDFDMSYGINNALYSHSDIIIIEVKQDKSGKSDFLNIMKQLHLRPLSLSKYGFGIANYKQGIRNNNFKKQIRYVSKISKQFSA